MAATLLVTPNPCTPSSTVNVHGAGFSPKAKIKLSTGGGNIRIPADGTFDIPLVVSPNTGNYTLMAVERSEVLASTGFTVVAVVPPPAPAAPSAPLNLTATAGDASIALAWTTPSSVGGAALLGYKVYRDGAFYTNLGVVTSWTNVGLVNGVSHSYTVSAVNPTEGPKSNSVSAIPVAPPVVDPPPVITSIQATNITSTTVLFYTTVNEVCQLWIEYGLTTAYGKETTRELSFQYQNHHQPASGLTPGTLYHYRAHIVDTGGNVVISPDQTFTTTGVADAPAVISAITVSNIMPTSARISWHTDEVAQGWVEYGPTTSYGTDTTHETSFQVQDQVHNISGLTASTLYHYKIHAVDVGGNITLSSDGTFTTAAPATTVPDIPTSFTATPSSTVVTLGWAAPVSNGGSAITGYKVYRNGTLLVTLGVVLTYANTGLTNGTTYSYTVSAVNAIGEGLKTAALNATPVAPPPPPPVISAITKTNITGTSVVISWHVSVPAQGWVEYGTTTAYGSLSAKELSFNFQDHSKTLTGLSNSTLYHFRIHAVDQIGNDVISTDQTVTTTGASITAPGVPLNLAGVGGSGQINLSWSPPTSNGGAAITAYKLYRNGTLLTTLGNVTSYVNTGLTNGTTYTYAVSAVNSAGEGTKTANISVTLPISGTLVPATTGALASAISAAASGATLLLRGGTHTVSSMIITSKAITIQNYPNERPVITHPTNRPDFLYNEGGPALIKGIVFQSGTGTFDDSQGSALAEVRASAHDVTYDGCEFHGQSGMASRQQLTYIADKSSIMRNITYRNCLFDEHGGHGFGIHIYPGPGPVGILVVNNVFQNFTYNAAVLVWADASQVVIDSNRFYNCVTPIRHNHSLGTIAKNNVGTGGGGIQIDSATNFSQSNNSWS